MGSPLKGITVIDVTTVLSGPYCTMLLGDMGAKVIKIEPLEGDMIRKSPPFVSGESTYYLYTNRNKKSIAIDLKKPEGLKILLKLVEDADVFVENYKPNTKNRLNIDYPKLKKINPRLIYCSISGFGQTGPWADRPGFDQIAQGMSGLMSITGIQEAPTRVGVAIGDSIASLFATYGILSAIIERQTSNEGQYLETSLLESLIAVLGFQAAKYFGTNEAPLAQGNDHASFAPYGTFKTKDGHINIAAAKDSMWIKLCNVLDLNHLIADSLFKTNANRVQNKDSLRNLIEEKLQQKTSGEWIDILNENGVASGPLYNIEEVFTDIHILHRKMLMEVKNSFKNPIKLIGFPVKMERTPCRINSAPPLLGEHTISILKKIGYSNKEIDKLVEKKVI